MRPARQSRTVTFLYGGVASALLVVIAAVALVLAPPTPPSVAEYAPTPDETIEDAPDSQSSRFGSRGAGACAEGQECEYEESESGKGSPTRGGTSDKREIIRTKVRRCVGDPPRQIEDPQSPPCINYWDGDNGGATSPGVTRDEIRLVVPCVADWACGEAMAQEVSAYAEFFNRRFEFYGRRLRVIGVTVAPGPTGGDDDPVVQRAVVEKVAEHRPFATFPIRADMSGPFREGVAAKGIISVAFDSGLETMNDLRAGRPFLWNYGLPANVLAETTAELMCKSLVGRVAEHGGPDVSLFTRKFGVIVPNRYGMRPDAAPLLDRLEQCGADVEVAEVDSAEPGAPERAMSAFRARGVTTVIPFAGGPEKQQLFNAASDVSYTPEWILMGFNGDNEEFVFAITADADQRSHVFGLASSNRMLAFADEPWYWAMKEIQPDFQGGAGGQNRREQYYPLLLLASGIQMAGPTLTPETLERGLQRTRFPNPNAGQAPYWQARVGFGPGDYSMVDDLALLWWDEAARNPNTYSGTGQFCYIGRGTRYAPRQLPEGRQPFFDRTKPCR
jgi:hypothetical protein